MLISAKFSYHLNKAYSIVASAASNKRTLEEERGLFSLRYAGREGYKWLSLFLLVMICNRDQYQLNLCVLKDSHSLEIVLQPLQMSPQCLSFIVPSVLNPSLDGYQHPVLVSANTFFWTGLTWWLFLASELGNINRLNLVQHVTSHSSFSL